MKYLYDDGGRSRSGYLGSAGDCVVRSIAIALEKPYQEVYDSLNDTRMNMRQTKRVRGSSARSGVSRPIYEKYLLAQGWKFTALMGIGTGCKFHLKDGELPMGRLICVVSKHLCAVIDGVLHDTYAETRNGTRCVYGYYSKVQTPAPKISGA